MTEPFGHKRNNRPVASAAELSEAGAAAKEGSMPTPEPIEERADALPESAKRKQILDGARRVFFAQGFAAASMGEIARAAKVSKGTLYVYFDSKEALFTALVEETKRETAERATELDADDPDVANALTELGVRLIGKMVAPQHVAMVRMVIGAAEQFPELGRIFYDAGPGYGMKRLAAYLAHQHERGRLVVPDPETAAWQLNGMLNHPVSTRVLLAGGPVPDEPRIRSYAEDAVATFMAAYGPEK
jgi:AcrR family transcriptional regulator